MIRVLLALLGAFALAISPFATSAVAAPAEMPGCTLDGHMPAKSLDHSKMDCCTPACQVSATAALLPEWNAAEAPLQADGTGHDNAAIKELASFTAFGPDPPPRLPS